MLSSGGGPSRRHRWLPWRAKAAGPLGDRGAIDARYAAEIDATLAAVGVEEGSPLPQVVARLRPLVERQVPVRALQESPVAGTARLRFADGTTILVRGATPGDVGLVALAVRRGSVTGRACRVGPGGATVLVVGGRGIRRGVALVVEGLDQPN